MEEMTKTEELNSILESIHKAIELYNGLNPNEKVTLSPQPAKKDVKFIYICVYNHDHVGLFKKINWSSRITYDYFGSWENYNAGSIYLGIDSNYVGMKQIHEGYKNASYWQKVGTKIIMADKSYLVNCNMSDSMSFDDMRFIMYNEGKIGPYEIGKASSEEMLEVLKFAYDYYQIDQNNKKKK